MPPPFPTQIAYMRTFLEHLESLPPDALNEDVDPTLLIEALRQRLSHGDAESTLNDDRQYLENWLDSFDSTTHAAHWISGFLFSLTAADLLEDDPIGDQDLPKVSIKLAAGWTLSETGFELRKGKLLAVVMPLDEFSFDLLKTQTNALHTLPHENLGDRTLLSVTFGKATGQKSVIQGATGDSNKQINYLLAVPGGHTNIRVWGTDFDESELESMLATLTIVQLDSDRLVQD